MISEFSANRDEHEQRTEQVGEVRDEVQVVVEDDGVPRGVMRHELVLFLVEVEHHRDGDDEYDGKDVRPQELLDDVPIQEYQGLLVEKPCILQ